jgi:hypothetical protein
LSDPPTQPFSPFPKRKPVYKNNWFLVAVGLVVVVLLPASYGNWKAVYNRHRRWSADGTWARVLSGLQRGCAGAAHLGAGRRVGAPTSYVDSRRITRVPVSTRSADHVRVGTSIP